MTTPSSAVATRKGVPHLVEFRGGAMGSSLHIIATSDQGRADYLAAWAQTRVAELEQRWSRFIATSEISQLNAHAGSPLVVSQDTLKLIRAATEARDLSGGRFDPTLLQAIQANGYDRTFVSIKTPVGLPALDTRRIGLGTVTINEASTSVTLGRTTGFDPGGIGKGLAADLVAEEMMERGAAGALINIGGDVRCIGEGPAGGSWVIAVGDAIAGVKNQIVELGEGAIASSTSRRRRWVRRTPSGNADTHHLLDPHTGLPSETAALLVTVFAARCADAEWLATALAAEGSLASASSMIDGASAMMVDRDGKYSSVGSPEVFLR